MQWKKIKQHGQRAGKEVVAVAEAAFLTLKDPDLSLVHKGVIFGSLVYFLSPLDAIPDFLPGGFADDVSVLMAALMTASGVGKKHLDECRLKHGLVVKSEDLK